MLSLCVLFSISPRQVIAGITEIRLKVKPVRKDFPFARNVVDRPRLILALSGGGTRGIAHLGVLKALEDAGIKPDGLAGVSAGALIGSLYGSGFSTSQIFKRLQDLDFERVIIDQPDRRTMLLARKQELSRHLVEVRVTKGFSPILPGAISPGQRLYQKILELSLDLPYRHIDNWNDLPVPVSILATDLRTGSPVVFNSGDPALAIRASTAIPLLFDPLIVDSLHLIDGGIFANIPVDLAKEMGGDVIVAVDVTADLIKVEPPYQPWQVVDQVTTILQREGDSNAIRKADFVIIPEIQTEHASGNYNLELVMAGLNSVNNILPDLRKRLNPDIPEDTLTLKIVNTSYHNFKESSSTVFEFPDDSLVSVRDVKQFLAGLLLEGDVQDVFARYDDSTNTLSFNVQYTPYVKNVNISGNTVIPDSVLQNIFGNLTGGHFDFDRYSDCVKRANSAFRDEGYVLAGLEFADLDTNSGNLRLSFADGKLGTAKFLGLKRVPERLLDQEIPLRENEPVTKSAILKSVNNLYATGLFRNVYPVITKDKSRKDRWNVVFYIQEHPSPPIRLGLAYQSKRRTRGFAELSWPSPLYYSGRIVLFTSVGELDDVHRISFLSDKIAGLPLMYDLSLGYNSRDRRLIDGEHHKTESYKETRLGGYLDIGVYALQWGLLALTSRWEDHQNTYMSGKSQYHLTAIGTKLGVDYLDRYPYPHRGMKFEGALETSGTYLGSNVEFTRFWSSLESYVPLGHRYTLGFRLLGRTADRTTPRDEKFRLGGIHEFPGLYLDEKIGLVQVAGGLDLRFDLLSRMLSDAYLGIRIDTGGSWDDPEARIVREDLMLSMAVYLVFDTILGPIHLQWGHLESHGDIPGNNILFLQAGNLF